MNVEILDRSIGIQEKLTSFVETLVYKFKPLQIYTFSKNVITNTEIGCFTPSINKQKIHYFLLMIMESPTL